MNYPIKISNYKHREEIRNIDNIEKVKEELINKIGYILVFFFLVKIFNKYDYKGPYVFMEKGLLLLYHLITGNSFRDMEDFMPSSSFHEIYKQFWNNNKNELNRIFTELLENMFSSTILRIINAKEINPIGFKNQTLFLDGHDSRIDYLKKDIKKRKFYSYKFKKSGLRTQVVCDINQFVIYVSESKPCRSYNDGQMFLDMKLEYKLNENDCLAFDGGYYYYVEKFIENCEKKGNDRINISNFMFPIRKNKNEELTDNEVLYNETFGSFRSKVEGYFGLISNKFKRFNNNERNCKITDIKTYNIQLKLVLLLLNIQKFVDLYSIPIKPNHILWSNENFNYPNLYKELDNIIYRFDLMKIADMNNRQSDYLYNYFNYNDIQRIKELNMDIESDNDKENFEVEKILSHRKFKKRMKFLVKWKNYDESYNEWVWQENFNETSIIDEYLETVKC